MEIWERTQEMVKAGLGKIQLSDLAAVGVTNQRETTVVWDRSTGQPVHNAIVWQDTRTDQICNELSADGGQDRFRAKTGLPIATYFSRSEDQVDPRQRRRRPRQGRERRSAVREHRHLGDLAAHRRTGRRRPRHRRDQRQPHDADEPRDARLGRRDSRHHRRPARDAAARSAPSSEVYGEATGDLAGIPVAGDLGDQQAALFGQTCFAVGEAKNTYGTGCFMLLNTGDEAVPVEERPADDARATRSATSRPSTALEGSIAITGALVQWLRDNLGLIRTPRRGRGRWPRRSRTTAASTSSRPSRASSPRTGASDARGVIAGLTRYVNKGHIARAALEATAWQTPEVRRRDERRLGRRPHVAQGRRRDGLQRLLMQFQADVLGVPVIRPTVAETTALGAAYAAGLATGFWSEVEDLRANWGKDKEWQPPMDAGRAGKGVRPTGRRP